MEFDGKGHTEASLDVSLLSSPDQLPPELYISAVQEEGKMINERIILIESEGKKKTAEEVALDLEELRNLQSIAKQPHNVNLFASAIHTLEEELALDLEELRNLQSIAKRPHTVNLISSVICTLEKLPQGTATSVSTPALQYEKQDNDNVKLSQGGATLPTPTPISTAVSTPAHRSRGLTKHGWKIRG